MVAKQGLIPCLANFVSIPGRHIVLKTFLNSQSHYMLEHIMNALSEFVKEKRQETNLTQEEFADRAGVALTVIRKIEQGKENLNLETVNQVLKMFGHSLAPVSNRELIRKKGDTES